MLEIFRPYWMTKMCGSRNNEPIELNENTGFGVDGSLLEHSLDTEEVSYKMINEPMMKL